MTLGFGSARGTVIAPTAVAAAVANVFITFSLILTSANGAVPPREEYDKKIAFFQGKENISR